jgi:hypothetical protein
VQVTRGFGFWRWTNNQTLQFNSVIAPGV